LLVFLSGRFAPGGSRAFDAALMAEVKALGAIARDGWRPRRTLVYASWDGEEPGLMGSTEWCETHSSELRSKLILYVNTDTNSRGFLQIAGSNSFQFAVEQAGSAVRDPGTGVSAMERLRARILVDGDGKGAGDGERREAQLVLAGGIPGIEAMGSGSDFTPFLQHLGIASLDVGYSGENQLAGAYHSAYDSFEHYVRFGDPDFAYGKALAETAGRMVLRTANADILPMRFGEFAAVVAGYGVELHEMLDRMRAATRQRNRLIDERAFQLAADPREKYVPPEKEAEVPSVSLGALDGAILRLRRSAEAYDRACARSLQSGAALSAARQAELDRLLREMEQTLLSAEGLPGRPWYRHMIFAPGLKTGYGVKTLPGVREGIEERRWPEAERYAVIVAGVLGDYCERLDRATALLEEKG